jgi:hypothetical protein
MVKTLGVGVLSARNSDETGEPQFRAVHGRRYTSKIPTDQIEFFSESLYEFTVKTQPSKKDRSKQVFFNIPDMGKISLSKSNGTVVVDTNRKDPFNAIKTYIGEPLYRSLMNNKMQTMVGVHIPKIAIENKSQTIRTSFNFPGTDVPITYTASKHTNYVDFTLNIKMPNTLHEKLLNTPRVLPSLIGSHSYRRKRVPDQVILDFAMKNGSIMTKDAHHFNLKRKSLGYRLNRLTRLGEFIKVGQSPATYYPTKESSRLDSG